MQQVCKLDKTPWCARDHPLPGTIQPMSVAQRDDPNESLNVPERQDTSLRKLSDLKLEKHSCSHLVRQYLLATLTVHQ